MPLSEFALIERYFRHCGRSARDVALGRRRRRGAAGVPAGLRAGRRHRYAGRRACISRTAAPPASIGHRALAVNLSDLAAMGARPAWALLALTLPQADEAWLAEFAARLRRAGARARRGAGRRRHHPRPAVRHRAAARARAARRARCGAAGGRPGDVLFVSGTAGDAAAGLALEQGRLRPQPTRRARSCASASCCPTPRVALGERLREHRQRLHRRLRRPARGCRQAGRRQRRAASRSRFEALPLSRRCVRGVGGSARARAGARPAAMTTSCVSPCRRARVERSSAHCRRGAGATVASACCARRPARW